MKNYQVCMVSLAYSTNLAKTEMLMLLAEIPSRYLLEMPCVILVHVKYAN